MTSLTNSYLELPASFYEKGMPCHFKAPKLLAFNQQLSDELGLNLKKENKVELAQYFSGQKLFPGSDPISLVYAAHQFGHFVPRLGDGRAHLLGEISNQDIQLKGSGQTVYSRSGDGRSPLGAVVREYIISEFMHALKIPTTRALAAVATGESILRSTQEYKYVPGGVFTRVAPGHIRVGTFQYFSDREDKKSLSLLLNYSLKRNYPALLTIKDKSLQALSFIELVGNAQADLIAKWMAFGFIHGVMNTDNSAIGGFTIDFGPCAFMDGYNSKKVFSSIDRHGRYNYENQVEIGKWNLLRLAESLISIIDDDPKIAIAKIERMIEPIMNNFSHKRWVCMAQKFGIKDYKIHDQDMMLLFLNYLEEFELDFTLAFRTLPNIFERTELSNHEFFPESDQLNIFLNWWRQRVRNINGLNLINPIVIARNHQVAKAIEDCDRGNENVFNELLTVLSSPFDINPKYAHYINPPNKLEEVTATFCGT